MQKIFCTKTYL